MDAAFRLTIDPEGIGRLVFDFPGEKINKISMDVLIELDALLTGLADNPLVKALVITSAKEGVFIAGADLKSFEGLFRDRDMAEKVIDKGHSVFSKLENLPFPSIAVINGACLGGGLELALACTYRIVGDHPKTDLGLPETTLGLFPGWGGTIRLPRTVGLTQGITMIVSGAPVNAKKAWKIKLADAIVPWEFIEEKTDAFVQECLKKEGREKILRRRRQTGLYQWLFEKNPMGRFIVFWESKRKLLKKTKGFYPSPMAALRLIRATYAMPLERGLLHERKTFLKSMDTDLRYAKNLIQIFFDSEAMKKNPGLPGEAVEALPVRSAGVIGAGTMGSGISWLMSYRDIPVRMKDIHWEAVGKGYAAAWDTYKALIKMRKLTPKQANLKFHQLAGTIDYTGFHRLDFIIEAAVENLELKKKILQEAEARSSPEAIIATNTSSLTIDTLAKSMKHPERFLGMHFFNPPSRMPLVEIVAGDKTSRKAIVTAVELCKKLKKTPIVVKDCPGFLVNRIFVHGFMEIIRMLEEGIEMQRLDRIFLKFGMPMEPFVLADVVGNDVNLEVIKSFERAYGERMKVPHILEEVSGKGWLGKKTGKGFYVYRKKSKKPNPRIRELVGEVYGRGRLSDEDIIDRAILAMVNEASRCLEEEIVAKPEYIDMALIFGVGFPPFRGGLLRYADTLGIHYVCYKLKNFREIYGNRYAPSALLIKMEKESRGFF